MEKKVIYISLIGLCSYMLSSCVMFNFVPQGEAIPYTNELFLTSRPEQVIYYEDVNVSKYTTIGRVTAQNHNIFGFSRSRNNIMAELKKQASFLGANGLTRISTCWEQTTAQAIIIK